MLEQIGIEFEVDHPDIDESQLPGEAPAAYVIRMARSKVRACAQPGRITLAADTIVVLDDEVLGKPCSKAEGVAMLLRLSDREHEVITAVAVSNAQQVEFDVSRTRVTFGSVDKKRAAAYWESGEPADKAGGYGIQGIGGIFVVSIQGSYSAVVGLPLAETERLLERFGLPTWRHRKNG